MKPLNPEFIAPIRPHRMLWWAVMALVGGALTACVLGWRQQVAVQDLRQQMKAVREAARAPVAAPAAPAVYADSAREFLAEHGSDWASTLLALERTAMEGVTPVAIDLQSRDRSARIEVEFADYAVLMRYLEQLNGGQGAAEWSLVSAQRPAVPMGAANASTAILLRRW